MGSSAAQRRSFPHRANPAGPPPRVCDAGYEPFEPSILDLPILTRSAELLNLLLQDGTVDLDLASSVVSLDAGLAFMVLQLANRDRGTGDVAIWQLPMAIVAGGQQRILRSLNRAPRIETALGPRIGAHLLQLSVRAVVRGAIAQVVAVQLGGVNLRQAFLGGLLFELPGMVQMTAGSRSLALQRVLRTALDESLPPELATVIADGSAERERPRTSLAAAIVLADAFSEHALGKSSPGNGKLDDWAQWQCGQAGNAGQWHRLTDRCFQLARWVAANVQTIAPWEFAAKVGRNSDWE